MERRRYRQRRRAIQKNSVLGACTAGELKTSKSLSSLERTPRAMIERIETTPVSAEGTPDPKLCVQDHLLLVVKAMVNGTSVSALVDSGASRSFIRDDLKPQPPLNFIGAYSSLEMANGETIVSTGIAPDVLLCTGTAACRLSLTAVPLMEGVDVILGQDWLHRMNPFVDWRVNSLVIRSGDKLEVIPGLKKKKVTQCKIVDRGLPGLQHSFSFLKEQSAAYPSQNWGEQLARLNSPTFWEYKDSAKPWGTKDTKVPKPSVPRETEDPQGGAVTAESPEEKEQDSPKASGVKTTRTRNIAGKIVKQPVRTKVDFVSMRQAARWANNTDKPMFLCVLRAKDLPDKRRAKTTAGAAKGLSEGEKRRLSKETGPVTKEIPVEEVIRTKVETADPAIREKLKETLEEYRDIFPDKLPYGRPPKRVIKHEIETTSGATPPHKSPYRLSGAELDEMRR